MGVVIERFVRWVAARLVRGAGADVVLGDLEESMRRDVERGLPRRRARWRYLRNAVLSSYALVRTRRPLRGGAGVSVLDLKLGLRMLVKHPGLTIVGGIAIAVAVASGGFVFGVFRNFIYPELPLPEPARIVGIENVDVETGGREFHSVHDFVAWRERVRTIEDISAFATVEHNLILGDGDIEPVAVAEMSASAFRLLRVAPVLGRTLVEADERPDAPPVLVIGYDVWRSRFGGDPGVIGRTVRLGRLRATVVGVMPDGFGFPVRHSLWMPLRVNELEHEPREGPAIWIFGRLAAGVTMEEAHTELSAIGSPASVVGGRIELRPRLRWYPHMISPPGGTERQVVESMLGVLIVIASINVATLVFARAAGREAEIAVRAALGASRRRIVFQLVMEAFVLVGVATGVGVLIAALVIDWGTNILISGFDRQLPYWWKPGLGARTMLYVGGAALLATLIVGVVPALKVTAGLGTRLQQVAAGGARMRFGGVWTVVVVFQVALAIAVLPLVSYFANAAVGYSLSETGFAAEEFITARVEADVGPASDSAHADVATRVAALHRELERRLEAEPGVTDVTFARLLPGMGHPRLLFDVEGSARPADPDEAPVAGNAEVDIGFFDALGVAPLAGRDFHPADVTSDHAVVIVSRSFVRNLLGDQNAIGRRIRIATYGDGPPNPWLEIVGVVPDLGKDLENAREHVYRPLAPGGAAGVRVAARVSSDPAAFTPRLREIVRAIDPTLRLYDVLPLDDLVRPRQRLYAGLASFIAGLAAVALLLSGAGTYALMSFTVARRTREIGIRTALGARPRQVLTGIFARAAAQLGIGVLVGGAMGAYLAFDSPGTFGLTPLILTTLIPLAAGLLACGVPAARALRVQPTEALRDG